MNHRRRSIEGSSPRAWLLPLLAILSPAACTCGKPPVEVRPTVSITRPADGQTLHTTDDEDASAPGIQFSVQATLAHVSDQSKASLLVDGLPVDGMDQVVSTQSGAGTVRFAKPTLPAGTHAVSVKVVDKASAKVAADTKSVNVEQSVACTFTPADGTVLTARQIDVTVSCPDLASGTPVTLTVQPPATLGGKARSPVAATYGSSGVTFPSVGLEEGADVLHFEAQPPGGALVAAEDHLTVNTGGCAVWLADSDDAIYNAKGEHPATGAHALVADTDPTLPGIQGHFTAAVDTARCPAGSTATLSFNGAAAATAAVQESGSVAFDATIPDGDPVTEVVTVVAGSMTGTSLPNTYHVDSVVPQIELVKPSGTLNPADDHDTTRPGMQTTSVVHVTAGVDSATDLSVQDGTTQLITPAHGQTPDGNGNITLIPDITLADGPHQLVATAQRRLGNVGQSAPVAVQVNQLSVVIVEPTFAVCNLQNDADPSTPACDLTFKVRVDPAVTEVDFTGPGAPANPAVTPVGGLASASYQVPQGPATLTATARDAAGNTSSARVIITVDTIPPTVTFVSPTDGAVLSSQTNSVQIHTTDAETGQILTISSSLATTNPIASGAIDATGSFTANVNLPIGRQTLTASVSDKAGNAASASIGVSVTTTGCDVVLDDPPTSTFSFNTVDAAVSPSPDGGPATGIYSLRGHSTLCPNGTVTFTKILNGLTTGTVMGTATADASGAFTFAAVFADGEADATLNVAVKSGSVGGPGINLGYTADFTPPVLDSAAPGLGNLFVVNASNPHLAAGDPGYVADADGGAAGGQVDLNLAFHGVGSIGIAGSGSAAIAAGTAQLFSQTYASNGPQTLAQEVTLAEGYSGPVTVTLTDAAGNVTVGTWNAKVATQALPTPTLASPAAGTINVFRDIAGDRATYAVVQSLVNFSAAPPPGAQIYLCSTIQAGSLGPCGQSGFFELAGTRQAASGSSHFYAGLKLPEGAQQVVAELADAVGDTVDSAPVSLLVDTVSPVVTAVTCTEDVNADGVLSGTELPPGSSAHFSATFTGVEDGQIASLLDGSSLIASATVSAGAAGFTVSSLTDGPHSFKVLVSDQAGNPNESTSVSPAIANPTDALSLTVERIAPSISVVAPTFAICNQSNDKNPATPDCELDFTVLVGGGATQVAFSGPGSPTPALVPSSSFTSGRATATYTLAQGGPYTLTATVSDQAGNTRSAQVSVSVDTVAPTISFTSPTPNQVFTSQVVPISVTTTGAEAGQTVTVTSSANGQVVGTGAVAANGTASFNANVPGSNQTLFATVTDQAGNVSNQASVAIQLNLSGCDINFTNPAGSTITLNATSAPGGKLHVAGNSTRAGCQSQPITFFAQVGGGPNNQVGSGTTDASGSFAFDYTFGDGTVTIFSAQMTVGQTNTVSFTATTDVTPPTLTIVAPTPNSSSQLFVVAQTGNVNVKNGVAGYVADADSAAGGQVSFNLSITGGASSTSSGTGSLVIKQGSTVEVSQAITSNGTVTFNPLPVTFDQDYVGPVTLTVTDAAGNTASQTWNATVDVVPPGVPQVVTTDPGNGQYTHVVNERHADIDVYFATPIDDGPTGQTLTWDFGYSTSTLLGTATFDDTAFDNAALTTKVTGLGTPGAPGTVVAEHLQGLPPLNTFSFAPRMVDGVGNRSAMASTAVSDLWNDTGDVTLAFPKTSATAARFGSSIVTGGDIDGDGHPDFVVSAPTSSVNSVSNCGSVVVYYGGSLALSRYQEIDGSVPNSYFGSYLALRDINGDGHADLLVYSGAGQISVYLAPSGGGMLPSTPSFVFSSSNFLYSVRTIPNANGLNHVLVGNPFFGNGIVYLFYGRADWSGLISGGKIDVSKADKTISGTVAGGFFSQGVGFIGIPDIDGDGKGELLIPAYGVNTAYLFLSGKLNGPGNLTAPIDADEVFTTSGGGSYGSSAALADVNMDGKLDLLIGDAQNGNLFAYNQNATHLFDFNQAQAPLAFGPKHFGASLAAGDANLDGKTDVIVGSNNTSAGQVSVLWSSSSSLVVPAGSVLNGGAGYGISVGAMDVDGNGTVDLIIGESANGNGDVKIKY